MIQPRSQIYHKEVAQFASDIAFASVALYEIKTKKETETKYLENVANVLSDLEASCNTTPNNYFIPVSRALTKYSTQKIDTMIGFRDGLSKINSDLKRVNELEPESIDKLSEFFNILFYVSSQYAHEHPLSRFDYP